MQIRKQGTHPKRITKYDVQQQISKKRDVFDYLGENPKEDMQTDKLKIRLIREGMLKPKCDECDRKQWRDESITLELDHIDGDNENNSLGNLRLLCPNCHSQTPEYRSRTGETQEDRNKRSKIYRQEMDRIIDVGVNLREERLGE